MISDEAPRCEEILNLGPCPRQARRELADFTRRKHDHAKRVIPAIQGLTFPPSGVRCLCKFWSDGRHALSIGDAV